MEENDRQRVSDIANDPSGDAGVTAVTSPIAKNETIQGETISSSNLEPPITVPAVIQVTLDDQISTETNTSPHNDANNLANVADDLSCLYEDSLTPDDRPNVVDDLVQNTLACSNVTDSLMSVDSVVEVQEVVENMLTVETDSVPTSNEVTPASVDSQAEAVEENSDPTDNKEEEMVVETNVTPVHNFDGKIHEITGAWEEFQLNHGECFTKGCKWSPDGTCLLTNSDDNVLRIFDLPTELHCQESWSTNRKLAEMRPVLKMAEGGLIYDYCWYPLMSSWDPLSCCLVSTAQNNPIHMWDAFTGELRATYRAYNQVDEVEAASCVAFDPHGEKLYCGFKNVVRVFDTARPGRHCQTRWLKDTEVAESQRGIVSCISVNPAMPSIYAVGTYLKSVGLYSEPSGSALCLMTGHSGGVTHLAFSPDGTQLFSGGRKDNEIICWDIRNPGRVLFTVHRQVSTNQRILFDLTPDGRFLLSGNSDGHVTVWDLLEPPVSTPNSCDMLLPSQHRFQAHGDCANAVSVHQQYPLLATSSGQRHFPEPTRDSSDSDGSSPLLKRKYIRRENAVKLWWTGKLTS